MFMRRRAASAPSAGWRVAAQAKAEAIVRLLSATTAS
jgi:hypothetical protein